MISRRTFITRTSAGGFGLVVWGGLGGRAKLLAEFVSGSTLEPATIGKYLTPLLIPPAMPRAGKITVRGGKNVDYYEIAVRQFSQQILPKGLPPTTVRRHRNARPRRSRHPRDSDEERRA